MPRSIAVLLVAAFSWAGCGLPPKTPPTESFRGLYQTKIDQHFGPPAREWWGHYGNPPEELQEKYPRVKSSFYDLPDRDLYVTWVLRSYNFLAIRSDFVPKGTVF